MVWNILGFFLYINGIIQVEGNFVAKFKLGVNADYVQEFL